MTWHPAKSLDTSAAGGYTEARYKEFTVTPNIAAYPDLDGRRISFVPQFTANGSVRYRLPWLHLYVHGEVIAVGQYSLTDPINNYAGPTSQDA